MYVNVVQMCKYTSYMGNIHQLGTPGKYKTLLETPQTTTIMAPSAELRALAIKLLRSSPSLGSNRPGSCGYDLPHGRGNLFKIEDYPKHWE